MAQTTVGMNGISAAVRVSSDNATWTVISGSANQIAAAEQTRQSGEAYTFDGDTAIVTAGKREPVEVTMRALYTESATESFEKVRAFFEAVGGTPIYLRWAPSGVATGREYACDAAIVTKFSYPPVDAGEAAPIAVEFGFRCKQVTPYHGGVPLSEYLDLKTLYDTFVGASWGTKTNWLSDAANVSTWFGITVASNHVTVIDLDANSFTDGNLPTTWGAGLPYLITVDLSDNALLVPAVDAMVTAFYTNRLVFTQPANCDIGGDNATPTGAIQAPAPCPAANCGEMIHELINDTCGTGHNTWTTFSVV